MYLGTWCWSEEHEGGTAGHRAGTQPFQEESAPPGGRIQLTQVHPAPILPAVRASPSALLHPHGQP